MSGAITIRLATRGELNRCLEIRRAAFVDQAPLAYSSTEVEALLDRDETLGLIEMIELEQLFVVSIESNIVGLGGWRGVNVYNLYVSPERMRLGIGSELLEYIERDFLEKSTSNTLYIDAGSYAERFYARNQYIVIDRPVSSDGLKYVAMKKDFS